MVHRKVIRSRLFFHPITDLHPSLDVKSLVAAALEQCLKAPALELAQLWDIAALLFKSQPPSEAEEGTANSNSGNAEGLVGSQVCRSTMTQV